MSATSGGAARPGRPRRAPGSALKPAGLPLIRAGRESVTLLHEQIWIDATELLRAAKERPEVPGRPAGDGRTYLTAGIVDAESGMVMVTAIDRESQEHRFTRQLMLGRPVVALNALDADRSGIIYLGSVIEMPGSKRTGKNRTCVG